ncbi:MAG TPA: Rossmann-like and DUF2520 domain-containing protein [Candidatus Acidoferrales bacterium]|nr:Rossmann-like and DUF2520 domain-containing protein [Candidatus Acidoferrales bacterium]
MARTVSIVGAGRVGISLGKHLRELGWRIGAVVTRSKATARAAVRRIGAGKPFDRPTAHVCDADVILCGTPDDALPAIAGELARVCGDRCKGKTVLHASATLDRSALAPLARLGASTGSLHPMQAFGGKVVPKLKGVIFGIEGDAKARRMAQSIAKSLGGIPVVIETADKPAYHAAAVMAGGSLYPLLEAGLQLLISIGFTRERASQTLLPLLHQILDNIERIGPRAAWTGPLSRGDYAVVAKHMKALRRYPPEFAKSYAALAELAARVLSKNPAATHKQLEPALGSGSKV